jgi:RNA polymerase sigma-70 factor, ECF subfamily
VTDTDQGLLRQLAEGDMEALGALYDRHARRVYHLLLAGGLETDTADEILPEVFLALAERGRKLRQVDNALGYLLGIARHLASRCRKSRARDRGATASPAGSDDLDARPAGLAVAPGLAPGDTLEMIELLRQLPAEQADVVVLKVWHGLTFEEIGQALQLSPNTAASRYRYGIDKLRTLWGDD